MKIKSKDISVRWDVEEGAFILSHFAWKDFLKIKLQSTMVEGLGYSDDLDPSRARIEVLQDNLTLAVHEAVRGIPTLMLTAALIERQIPLGSCQSVALKCCLEGNRESMPVEAIWEGNLRGKVDTFPCRLTPQGSPNILQMASDYADSLLNQAVYQPSMDAAVSLEAETVHISRTLEDESDLWKNFLVEIRCEGKDGEAVISVDFIDNLYRQRFRLPYSEPGSAKRFRKVPAGWLDWYYYYEALTQEELQKNFEWLEKNLKDYGLEYIQVDMGWATHHLKRLEGPEGRWPTDWTRTNAKFPHGLKGIAEDIKSAGFRPGIWLVPWSTNNAELVEKNPQWFFKDFQDLPVSAFSDWAKGFGKLLDFTVPQVLEEYIKPLFCFLVHECGFDYFKLDATGWVLENYRTKEGGIECFRRGLAAIRETVGNRFILACQGPCDEAMDLVDGARIAGDTRLGWRTGALHCARQTAQRLFTHRICWITDPDCLCIRLPLTIDQVRAWASMMGLSGQLLMLSDKMYELDGERLKVLRRILPVCDIHTLDLFSRPQEVQIWDLKIWRSFGSWDVVGIFNFEESIPPVHLSNLEFELDLSQMGLKPDQPYLVYDFWDERFLGKVVGKFQVTVKPSSCCLVAIHPLTDHPQVISTNRHVTQGGVDLVNVQWEENTRSLQGRSRIVRGDPYILRIYHPEKFWVTSAEADCNAYEVHTIEKNLLELTLQSDHSKEAEWRVNFQTEDR